MHIYNFIRFEIEERKHSPNAVIGIDEQMQNGKPKESRVFIMAPSASLGKTFGDNMALQFKACLEREFFGKTQ